jgi:hypothetical protein
MGNMEIITYQAMRNKPAEKTIIRMKRHLDSNLLRPAALVALVLAALASHVGAAPNNVTLLGQPFTPTGADFQIFALQGIDASHTFGDGSIAPQVNVGFEFADGIGVTYSNASNQATNFGIGLYQGAANSTLSTGLEVRYNAPVDAASVTVRTEDYDITPGQDVFFNKNKVEPSIVLLGANNTVIASAGPRDIFPNLVAIAPGGGKKANDDGAFDLNLGGLLSSLHLSDTSITGYILYADNTDGEINHSDPYFLVSSGSGMPVVPEPSNYLVGLAAVAFGSLFQLRQIRLHRKAVRA